MSVRLSFLAVAFGLALPFAAPIHAETPQSTDSQVSQPATPVDLSAAERRAIKKAEREARREARKAKQQQEQPIAVAETEAARAELKVAVADATANRPKGRLWCVPFARAVTGVAIRGNAKTWWAQAEGLYKRGKQPAVGAVMAFAASRAMPKGHVAVVSQVINDREILIDHANWERNRITLDTLVVDVSPKGDWSAVKVASSSGTLGRVNPVNGFIYN